MRFGEPHPGWIGATVKPIGSDEGAALRVMEMDDDAPVSRSGIKDGDLLVQVGRTPILKMGDLLDASFFLTADEKVPIIVKRGEQTLTFQVQAIRPPGSAEAIKTPAPAGEGMRLSLPH